jgi:pimeloyl-ACP methyl ester carboxylesterase
MIDFYGGPGTLAAWPERVRGYALQTTAINIMDWQSAYGFPLSPTILAKVEIPALVLRGEASHPAIKRANELLAQSMANSSLAALAGAAHFMISTHPGEVAGMIAQHVAHASLLRPTFGPIGHIEKK